MALAPKFSSLDIYKKFEGYQLLPFKFHRLTTDRYLLVNLVGEFLVTSKVDLRELVKGDLNDENQIYNELLAKHFILDSDSSVALDLLALKYRTKNHGIAQFTGLHLFVVTLRCDYSCKYCQVSRQMDGGEFDMDEEVAKKSLELVFQSPAKSLKIEFQGGEPLLNFKLIQFVVLAANSINETERRQLQFVITTNLSYISDEIVEFCKLHSIYISTSLDGPKVLHNKNRPRNNKDGYELTVAGIKKVQSALGVDYVSALMTTTNESLSQYKEIIDEYVNQNLHEIFLRPLSPYGFAIKTKQVEKYNISNWLDFYKKGMEYIFELNRAGYFLREQYSTVLLKKILTSSGSSYVDLQSPAGAGISAVVYNYDGDVYASDEARMLKEMGDDRFKLGNVNDNSYEEIFLSDVLLDTLEDSITDSVPMCSECGIANYCGSDPVYHYATQGDVVGKKPLSFFCRKNMSIVELLFSFLADPAKKKILESWL